MVRSFKSSATTLRKRRTEGDREAHFSLSAWDVAAGPRANPSARESLAPRGSPSGQGLLHGHQALRVGVQRCLGLDLCGSRISARHPRVILWMHVTAFRTQSSKSQATDRP